VGRVSINNLWIGLDLSAVFKQCLRILLTLMKKFESIEEVLIALRQALETAVVESTDTTMPQRKELVKALEVTWYPHPPGPQR
jgi:argininosuccinate lyase